jgi:hypothetical protein
MNTHVVTDWVNHKYNSDVYGKYETKKGNAKYILFGGGESQK